MSLDESKNQILYPGWTEDWPWPLLKALNDPFEYLLGLKDGTRVYFANAVARGDQPRWVTLNRGPSCDTTLAPALGARVPGPRGMHVRVSEIAWIEDAPFDS